MAGQQAPGPLGSGKITSETENLPSGAYAIPGPIGTQPPTPLSITRTVTGVIKSWDASKPRTTPEIVVKGTTLADVANELNKLPEWGKGGGLLRTDRIPRGNTTSVTVTLHANLVRQMPRWTQYSGASAAAKAEWDKMWGKLAIHEDRHVAIAVEEAEKLAKALIGREISEIAQMVTDANQDMQDRQDRLDTDTNSGAKPNVPYGDVIL